MITEVLRYSTVALVIAHGLIHGLAVRNESAGLHDAAFYVALAAFLSGCTLSFRVGYKTAIRDVEGALDERIEGIKSQGRK